MAIRIRLYKSSDKKVLAGFFADLQDHVACRDPHKRLRVKKDFDGPKYLHETLKLMKRQEGIIYFAEEKSQIVGYIFGIIPSFSAIENLEQYPVKDGKVVELFVRPEYRGKKIGQLLIEKMENHFRKCGCSGVRLEAWLNQKAHKFYKKLGYDDRTVSMLKIFKK